MTIEDVPRKSPMKVANELSILVREVLGEDRFPIDVGLVAKDYTKKFFDLIAEVYGDALEGFEGKLEPSTKKPRWFIVYNTATPYKGRERFTLAHEFGHYLLHRKPLTEADFRDDADPDEIEKRGFTCTPLELNQWREAYRQREEEADTFASYLLMPMDDYRAQVDGQEMTRELLVHCVDRYGVSLTAAIRKWIEFTDQRAAMVVSRDGFAQWERATEAALKTGIFVRSGMPIPDGSIAARGPDAMNGETNRPISLPEGVWRFKGGSEPVRELTIFANRLQKSISLLLFDAPAPRYGSAEPREWDTYDQFLKWG